MREVLSPGTEADGVADAMIETCSVYDLTMCPGSVFVEVSLGKNTVKGKFVQDITDTKPEACIVCKKPFGSLIIVQFLQTS